MDRNERFGLIGGSAVSSGQPGAVELLLRSSWGKPGKFRDNATDRQDLSGASVLRIAAHDGRVTGAWMAGEREKGGAVDAINEHSSDGARTAYQPSASGTSYLSLFIERQRDRASERSLVFGHYVSAYEAWIFISGGGYGLVQPVCSGLGALELAGDGVLRADLKARVTTRQAGDMQHRPRRAIYERSFHWPVAECRGADQHGRERAGAGQYLRGTALADGKVRRGLSSRLCRRKRSLEKSAPVFSVLQYRASASRIGAANSGGCLFLPELIETNGGVSAALSPQGCGGKINTSRRQNHAMNMIAQRTKKHYSDQELSKRFYTLIHPENCPTNGGRLHPGTPSLSCPS